MAKKKWKASDVIALLRERYSGERGRYVFCEQVAPATGYGHRATWIDGMALSLWPSDGLLREALEVKVARADFLSEVQNPEKNRWFKDNCHYFWYATGPGVVNSVDEIPEGCGWLLAQEGRIVCKKQATMRELPNTVSSEFFAAISRALKNESGRQVRDAEREVLNKPEIQLAMTCMKSLERWLTSKGVKTGFTTYGWTSDTEMIDYLDKAYAGSGNLDVAEVMEGSIQDFRESICRMVLELLPFAATGLGEVKKLGSNLFRTMGRRNFDLLADLRKEDKNYGRESAERRRERLDKIAFISEMLLADEVASEELAEVQQEG